MKRTSISEICLTPLKRDVPQIFSDLFLLFRWATHRVILYELFSVNSSMHQLLVEHERIIPLHRDIIQTHI